MCQRYYMSVLRFCSTPVNLIRSLGTPPSRCTSPSVCQQEYDGYHRQDISAYGSALVHAII